MSEIRLLGDSVLREKAEPVFDFDSEIEDIVQALTQTLMETRNALAVAAPQIGVSKRMFVFDNGRDIVPVINPHIFYFSDDTTSAYAEGCLSIPGYHWYVERPKSIGARFSTPKGEEVQLGFNDINSRCFQHEVDHLDGILVIDHIPPSLRKKFERQRREKNL